jgi:hypothetical protein
MNPGGDGPLIVIPAGLNFMDAGLLATFLHRFLLPEGKYKGEDGVEREGSSAWRPGYLGQQIGPWVWWEAGKVWVYAITPRPGSTFFYRFLEGQWICAGVSRL